MADNYGTLAGATAYFLARNNSDWSDVDYDDADRNAALLVASVWLDGAYVKLFPGYRTSGRAQPREWPRSSAIDIYGNQIDANTVPLEIENATYEIAVRQLVSPGSLNADFVPGVAIKQASVEGAVSVTFAGAATAYDMQLQIPALNSILYPILNTNAAISGGMSGLVQRG